jgi:hypothetical protein
MTSDDPLRDDEMETVRDQEPASPDRAAAPAGGIDTGVMMDEADSGTADQSDVPAPSGASDTGAMMDAADSGTIDRTDVGEPGDADAGEPGR